LYQPLRRSSAWKHSDRKAGVPRLSRPFTIEPAWKETAGEDSDRQLAERVERASRFGHNLDSFRLAATPGAGEGATASGVIQRTGGNDKKRKKTQKDDDKKIIIKKMKAKKDEDQKTGTEKKDNKRKRNPKEDTTDKEVKKRKRKPPSEFPDKTIKELKSLDNDWSSYGANQSRVFFKTKKSTSKETNPHKLSNSKINNIFKQSENVVGEKPYTGLREKQALRWMSTIAFRYLNKEEKDPREVQSALLDKLYMATNTGTGNKALEELVGKVSKGKKPGLELMKSMYSSIKDEKDLSRREKRHLKKFNKRILDDTTASKYKDYESIQKALEGPVTIASEGEEGLHAERRIGLKSGQKTLPPKKVGGVKRTAI
jgi:hypothetical protein